MPDPVGTGSGIDSQLGLEVETVYGTAVTPARFYEFLSASLSADVREIDNGGSLGRGRYARSDRVTTYIAGGNGATPMFSGPLASWPSDARAARQCQFSSM
mgnify:CR=1 FL=1